jgi:hypothetical protein
MVDYRETPDFLTLKKLSDLEKRVENDILGGKFKDMIRKNVEPMKKVVRIRFSTAVPLSDMDESIRSGTDEFASHVHARGIMLKPQEALYHAIGRNGDKALYDLLSGITITDIMSMIRNKAAVSQFRCGRNMDIGESDVPRHIKKIMILRSNLPDILRKEAKLLIDKNPDIRESFEFTTEQGEVFTLGSKSVNKNLKRISKYVDDGTIVKVIKLYHNGKKSTNLIKKADVALEDSLYLSVLYGF